MPLEEYQRKRDFKKTPEPAPDRITRRKKKLSYFIQKHDASRLHYDFRLEWDGVLLSWAVTKGPSLNPADKRLAVRTEDHPLSYGTFEGTIPKGEYGGGTVMLWDEGTWGPKSDAHAGLQKGHLSFTLHGKRLRGAWDLVHMRGNGKRENWLLIKHQDQEAQPNRSNDEFLEDLSSSVKSGRSMEQIASGGAPVIKKKITAKSEGELERLIRHYPEPQLATLVDKVPDGPQWIHEIKFDGYRLLGFVSGGACQLRTRNGNDWTARFPSLSVGLELLKTRNAVLDMEAVMLDAAGKTSFQALQSALGDADRRKQIVAYVFDLLHLDGMELINMPLVERKEKLRTLLNGLAGNALRYSEHIVGQGPQMFAKACQTGLEGIVSKRAGDPYVAGRRKSWLKIKCAQRQEFIILGYSSVRSGERALGAIYLGYHKDSAIRYAGKVGTGFSMQEAHDLVERFANLKAGTPVLSREDTGLAAREWLSIRWIKPVLLCEVAFSEWTTEGRVRHPSFQGLREDKDSRDVRKEATVLTATTSGTAASKNKPGSLVIEGVTITHPDRVISETGHITKGELAEYYAGIAPLLLPRIVRRPLSLLRCPSGIDGQCFYQRNPGRGLGADVHPFEFKHKGKRSEYLYIEDEKGLLDVVQMGAIEIHPWGATIDAIDYPDRLIFDLDPAPDVPFEALKLAAQDLRQRLQQKGLQSILKCTGGNGLHVTVQLAGTDKWPAVKSFAASVAEEMVSAAPDAYVATMSKAKRTGKIFVDYFRNDYTATAIADYAVRARAGATVALPLEWRELKSLKAANQFTMKDVLSRFKKKRTDAYSSSKGQTIPGA